MSNLQAATKVADNIMARLFNHRQFTSGEINFLIKELEEKGNSSGTLDRILNINQDFCVISDLARDDANKSDGGDVATKLCDELTNLLDNLSNILSKEDEQREKEELALKEAREERNKAISDCQNDLDENLNRLKQALASSEEDSEMKFRKFEQNLSKK